MFESRSLQTLLVKTDGDVIDVSPSRPHIDVVTLSLKNSRERRKTLIKHPAIMFCSVDRVDNGFIASVARIVDNTKVRLKSRIT